MAEDNSTFHTDYHIYGRRAEGRPRKHLAGAWDAASAIRQAEEYRSSGWKDVVVKPKKATKGRCLRSKLILSPVGRWVRVYLEEDLKAIARAIAEQN